ncbi:MAG: Uncharacterized protein CEN89_662 [Candidatus Berkelbacteria bacterium Licking1014_7]|uniref:Uncharacterized protein n=1 Tax=Candidatus Berkelbacteria bacterium Licking1014_7 TaxID=2017147 RepID=A0A554LHY9_9BACT|nr:MAG: Uncharacterized protein CEN89_662 [Candidatus Berkelbacteria bacterium Licking1014_7]
MTTKAKLYYLFVGTLFSFGVWLSILLYTNPTYADILTWLAFLASFFLWNVGFWGFVIFYLKVSLSNHEVIYSLLSSSLRQSAELSIIATTLLGLSALQVLGWWEAGLVILVVILTETFFQTKNSQPNIQLTKRNNE